MKQPKLRDSHRLKTHELYALNETPDWLVTKIAGGMVYLMHVGRKDLSGDDFGDIFAKAVKGEHLGSPLGIADVVLDKMAWSAKTVKNNDPFKAKTARLISGRCSPDYSYGITDPHVDVQKTGTAVLNIWNERVNIAQDNFNRVRTIVLLRNPDLDKFVIYEEENHRFVTSNYIWEVNPNGNLIGKSKKSGEHCFTWQPHGSQFTIISKIPESSVKFEVRRPPIMTQESVLKSLHFDESWVKILR
ncbi:MAG: hypothetical protein LIP02_05960 [Bacteroidales bacterium]|nr:hypothetical protein [Bacteroidales bacterium]